MNSKSLLLLATLSINLTISAAAELNQVVITNRDTNSFERPCVYSWQSDFKRFKGSYVLSNGMTMQLFNRGHFMYASLSDRKMEKLLAISPSKFRSTQSRLLINLEELNSGEITGDVSIPVAANLGQTPVNSAELIVATIR